ncbi:hypothetical protein J4211_03330 [Candidatus Woesearchaeota archaeon]|nr:hypothetical protein [Candidatus Woesearchaeota archaeon]
MEQWDEKSDKVSKLRPDLEKARALLKMTEVREKRSQLTPLPEFTTLLTEEYYEIIKELITGIMSIDGWKTVSHEFLIGYLARFYQEFNTSEVMTIDQLRIIRNDIAYRGAMISPEYLDRNQMTLLSIIQKLKKIVNQKLSTGKP